MPAERPRPEPASPRRSARLREIVLAAALTAAAVGFIGAALLSGRGGSLRTPSVGVEREAQSP